MLNEFERGNIRIGQEVTYQGSKARVVEDIDHFHYRVEVEDKYSGSKEIKTASYQDLDA